MKYHYIIYHWYENCGTDITFPYIKMIVFIYTIKWAWSPSLQLYMTVCIIERLYECIYKCFAISEARLKRLQLKEQGKWSINQTVQYNVYISWNITGTE